MRSLAAQLQESKKKAYNPTILKYGGKYLMKYLKVKSDGFQGVALTC